MKLVEAHQVNSELTVIHLISVHTLIREHAFLHTLIGISDFTLG